MNRLLIGLFAVSLFWSPAALSQQTPSDADMQKAAQRFDEAEKYYKIGEYQKALDGYKEAYLLSGEADLLFNIGQCHRKLGHNDDALAAYHNYLREKPDASNKSDVEAIIQDLETQKKNAPPPKSAPADPTPIYFEGEDTFFMLGGGLVLSGGFSPLLSGIANLGRFEAHAQLFGLGLNGEVAGIVSFGGHIFSKPRGDKNVRSLVNVTAGLAVDAGVDFENFDPITGDRIVQPFLFPAVYGANTFLVSSKFAARGEAEFLAILQDQDLDGNTDFAPGFFLSATAFYTLKRDPCP